MNTIELLTDDGLHLPALHVPCPTGPGRPLILIQEIFGINGAMRQAAQAWAAEGFEVLCPDLFARQERAVADLDAARQWLTRQDSQRPVCALGYCLGGRLAVMMALTTPIAASVSYYGVGLEGLIPDTPVKSAPCLLHIAENDAFVPAEARDTIVRRAGLQQDMPVHIYAGCDHAFARPDGEHFQTEAAELARQRTLAFLRA